MECSERVREQISDARCRVLLVEREVHLWIVSLLDSGAAMALLSDEERRQRDTFRSATDGDRFAARRAALRALLGAYTGRDPTSLLFERNAGRKPRVVSPGIELRFNSSSSGDLCLIAIAEGVEVGVDIERVNVLNVDNVAAHFFTARERSDLAALDADQQRVAFFRLWTRKEALLKAIGMGLATPLQSIEVSAGDDPTIYSAHAASWKLLRLPPIPGHELALAMRRPLSRVAA